MTTELLLTIASIVAIIVFVIYYQRRSIVKTTVLGSTGKEGNIYYYLPKGLLKITSKVKVFVSREKTSKRLVDISLISQSFEHESEIVPDNRQILTLNYTNNPFSKDDVNIKINDKGLLTSLNAIAEDRTPNIVESISKAPAEVLGAGGEEKGQKEDVVVSEKEFVKEFLLDPKELPQTVQWSISEHDDQGTPLDMNVSFAVTLEGEPGGLDSVALGDSEEIHGIVTRPRSLYKFKIEPKAAKLTGHEISFYEYLLNNGMNITIPLSRAIFAKKTNDLVLSDGVIKENKIVKPSEIEGFVSIPINIAKAIVSIPGQLFTFRIDNTRKRLTLEEESLKLEKAVIATERNKLLQDLETQKLKVEADKNLLEADKNLQTVQKELKTLENEIALLPKQLELKNQETILTVKQAVETLTKDISLLQQKAKLESQNAIFDLKNQLADKINENNQKKEKQLFENEKAITKLQKEVQEQKNALEKLKKAKPS
jgi:hypothetical protein